MAKVKKKVLASAAKVHGWKSKGKQHAARAASLRRIGIAIKRKAGMCRYPVIKGALDAVANAHLTEAKYLRTILR